MSLIASRGNRIVLVACLIILAIVTSFYALKDRETLNLGIDEKEKSSTRAITAAPGVLEKLDDNVFNDISNKVESELVSKAYREASLFNAYSREHPPTAPAELMDPKKILILSASDYSDQSNIRFQFINQAKLNRKQYATRYGFQYNFVNTSGYPAEVEHPVWLKLPLMQDVFDKHPEVEWIWWLDADALIINHDLDVRSHLLEPSVLQERLTYGRLVSNINDRYINGMVYPQKEDLDASEMLFVFGHDRLSINAGSFFVKRSKKTDKYLKKWFSQDYMTNLKGEPTFVRREQDAFIHMFFEQKDVCKRTALVPQTLFNSYPDTTKEDQLFQPGDFVIHFVGYWGQDVLISLWEDYWKMSLKTAKDVDP